VTLRFAITLGILTACGGSATSPSIATRNTAPAAPPFAVTLGAGTIMMGDQQIASLSPDGTYQLGDLKIDRYMVKPDGSIELMFRFRVKSGDVSEPAEERSGVAKLTTEGALLAEPYELGVATRYGERLPIEFHGDSATVTIDGKQSSVRMAADGTLVASPAPPDLPGAVKIVAADPKVRSTLLRLLVVVPMAQYFALQRSVAPGGPAGPPATDPLAP
jgi:hypothetical protein